MDNTRLVRELTETILSALVAQALKPGSHDFYRVLILWVDETKSFKYLCSLGCPDGFPSSCLRVILLPLQPMCSRALPVGECSHAVGFRAEGAEKCREIYVSILGRSERRNGLL